MPLENYFPTVPGAFYLETCQRWLFIANTELLNQVPSVLFEKEKDLKTYQGQAAYLFLLRLASGLESEIQGETDVFGQVKEAWRKFEKNRTVFARDFGPWMRKIFEDTKTIRSQFLQNLGGSSYGTLIRKLIKDQAEVSQGLNFLIGAGQIAHSIAPFLMDSELWLWNRSLDRLQCLYDHLYSKARSAQKNGISLLEVEEKGWKNASHIIVCTPFDSDLDQKRIQWLNQRERSYGSIIHLGGMREHSGYWNSVSRFYCLTDLFYLQNSLNNVRSVQISQAEKACEEMAATRAMKIPLSVCHDLENLATFA